ncbi:phosphatidylglycerophosphate synthase [Saccharothrix tamanrassetensis]|uniref:Phosphatidylglycerophosphate synthase n=1 Tax=Saccharothrix tamanrassetensis TaxID=1051531 RepID=A0A841C4Z9_9PSEU|nr:CDP-alcohol phosphatidyltransferase family protein [Saccharothrix tamanrassetensis]MBB5953602.1 phosphatidylglycerophosphate synthase [Saccharothrix tamanrassetensis]
MITLPHNTAPAVPEQVAWMGGQLLLLGLLGATVGLGPPGWIVGLAHGSGTWALLGAAMLRSGVRSPGPADRVTLARGVLVGGVTALVVDGGGTTVLVVFASVALALDFVDGRVARRTGTASPLGARFDMEVDAFLILVLSVQVAFAFGPWVLAIGAMRYVFVAASWVAPWLCGELPPSFARKAVAAVQGVVLVAAASGIVPFAAVLVGLALAALAWSFGRDVLRLRRNRVPVATAAVPAKEYSRV